jgi:hypothetical protein
MFHETSTHSKLHSGSYMLTDPEDGGSMYDDTLQRVTIWSSLYYNTFFDRISNGMVKVNGTE